MPNQKASTEQMIMFQCGKGIAGNDNGWWWKYSVKIFFRDKFTCQMCLSVKEAKELVAHHIVHIREGGNNEMKNLITLCKDCHQKLHKLDWQKGCWGLK